MLPWETTINLALFESEPGLRPEAHCVKEGSCDVTISILKKKIPPQFSRGT